MSIWRAEGVLKWDEDDRTEYVALNAPDWDGLVDAMARYELSLNEGEGYTVDWTDLLEIQRSEKMNDLLSQRVKDRKEFYTGNPDLLKAANESDDNRPHDGV